MGDFCKHTLREIFVSEEQVFVPKTRVPNRGFQVMSTKKLFNKQGVAGFLKLRVKRGINLAVRDIITSDPYIVATLDIQKKKTKVIKKNCNPEWNDELTLTVRDPKAPIHIAVYDKDMFSKDDCMGVAEIDVKPYIECLKKSLNLHNHPTNGTKLDCVHPGGQNYLADKSCIVWENGKIIQDMILRLRNVECGEVVIQIELVPFPGL